MLASPTPNNHKNQGRAAKAVPCTEISCLVTIGVARIADGQPSPDNPNCNCEMSCLDWYGNARPIFYQGRGFALIGREFAEGRIENDEVIDSRAWTGQGRQQDSRVWREACSLPKLPPPLRLPE